MAGIRLNEVRAAVPGVKDFEIPPMELVYSAARRQF
jgi:hypothetical protein